MKSQREKFTDVQSLLDTGYYSTCHKAGSTIYYTPCDGSFIVIVDYERSLARTTEFRNMTDLKASKRFVT